MNDVQHERRGRGFSTRKKIAMILLPSLFLIVLVEAGTRAFLLVRYGKQVPS